MEKDDITWNLFFHRIYRRIVTNLKEFSGQDIETVFPIAIRTITNPYYFRPAALGAYEMYFAVWNTPAHPLSTSKTGFMYASTMMVSISSVIRKAQVVVMRSKFQPLPIKPFYRIGRFYRC